MKNVYVWAVDSRTKAPTSYLTASEGTVVDDYYILLDSVANGKTLDVQFTTAGEYTLCGDEECCWRSSSVDRSY